MPWGAKAQQRLRRRQSLRPPLIQTTNNNYNTTTTTTTNNNYHPPHHHHHRALFPFADTSKNSESNNASPSCSTNAISTGRSSASTGTSWTSGGADRSASETERSTIVPTTIVPNTMRQQASVRMAMSEYLPAQSLSLSLSLYLVVVSLALIFCFLPGSLLFVYNALRYAHTQTIAHPHKGWFLQFELHYYYDVSLYKFVIIANNIGVWVCPVPYGISCGFQNTFCLSFFLRMFHICVILFHIYICDNLVCFSRCMVLLSSTHLCIDVRLCVYLRECLCDDSFAIPLLPHFTHTPFKQMCSKLNYKTNWRILLGNFRECR